MRDPQGSDNHLISHLFELQSKGDDSDSAFQNHRVCAIA